VVWNNCASCAVCAVILRTTKLYQVATHNGLLRHTNFYDSSDSLDNKKPSRKWGRKKTRRSGL